MQPRYRWSSCAGLMGDLKGAECFGLDFCTASDFQEIWEKNKVYWKRKILVGGNVIFRIQKGYWKQWRVKSKHL